MNLDDSQRVHQFDTSNMLAEIAGLPDQLRSAWEMGLHFPLPDWKGIQRVIIAGMGGSAIGADLLIGYITPICKLPVFIHRDYNLPAWAFGQETLLIASSHSGNTEETLAAFENGIQNGCRILAVTTGGKLSTRAYETGVPCWKFDHKGQPRAAVGFSFGLLLAAFTRLGLVPDQEQDLADAVEVMKEQQKELLAGISASLNPAKRLAGQLVGRWVNVIGAGMLAPVARRWKGQINELAKCGAGFDTLPEADHNSLAALVNPEETLSRIATVFIKAASDHPRNQLRARLTQKIYMLEGMNTNDYIAPGDSPLAQQWTTLHFGDYLSFYLAMAYQVDPSPVKAIMDLKAQLG
ncbi:MAG: bifunctional phosphoglucose/phosphomannose isomerase [Chloroflexi bacterium]|nr:MAG: bifunctional phosphoglucose/phosphomannose isomerase [Chloroflexota bacterium]